MNYAIVWSVRGDLGNRIAKVLPTKASGTPGRPALANQQVLNGILYVLRMGCQWESLKKEWFGASSSLHARYQAWREAGVFARIFQILLEYYDHLKRTQWRLQAIDSKSVPTPFGGENLVRPSLQIFS